MKHSLVVFAVLACHVVALGDDEPLKWPQFRGPGGSGISEDQQPPVELGPDKNVLWKVAVPGGQSSPIVVGDKLVITAFDEGKLYTIACSRKDGSELWRTEAPAEKIEAYHKIEGSPAASTCATDGERIVSYFGSCGLFCYDLDGKELWKHELPTAKTMADFGSGTSPIIAEGKVILLRDEAQDPKIIVLDLETGDVVWEKKRESRAGYCTPVVWETPDGKQIAAPGVGRMVGYDLKTGEEKWFVAGMPAGPCASPVIADGDLFYAGWTPGDPSDTSEFQMPTFGQMLQQLDKDGDKSLSKKEVEPTDFKNFFDNNDPNKDGKITQEEWDAMLEFLATARNSAFALKPGGNGDITETHVRWKQKRGLPYVPTAIVYRGQYVMIKDGGIITAYDEKTGKQIYQARASEPSPYYASPVAANGHIYFAALDNGTITVIKGGADKPEVVAKNPPLGERVAATPAIADDTLYVRTAGHLYAFGVKK